MNNKTKVINAEQLEAEQQEWNNKKEEFVAKLPQKEKEKFDTISKAIEILTNNDIPCVLFAELPSLDFYHKTEKDNPIKYSVHQYNNMTNFAERDINGNLVVSPEKRNDAFASNLVCSIESMLCKLFQPKSTEEFLYIFYQHRKRIQDWVQRFGGGENAQKSPKE